MQQVKKEFEKYSKKMKELGDFEKKHKDVIVEHFRLQEEARVGEFIVKEKIDMWIDENKLKEEIFLEDDILELRVKPDKKYISIFLKENYKQNDKPKQ